jgi:hypothetical protein
MSHSGTSQNVVDGSDVINDRNSGNRGKEETVYGIFVVKPEGEKPLDETARITQILTDNNNNNNNNNIY